MTVRLDPKLRYLAEIAARKYRRTLSSYIEWSIENSLGQVQMGDQHHDSSLADEAESLWDVDDADRFARLALNHPDLLTHEEQLRWKLIRENGYFWYGNYKSPKNRFVWDVDSRSFIWDRLREFWPVIVEAAETGDASKMPTWTREKAPEVVTVRKPPSNFEDMDDDIPF